MMTEQVDMSDVFEQRPSFYSKNAVAVCSFFLSPLLGCILFAYNLKEVGKGKTAWVFVFAGIVWIIAIRKLTGLFLPNAMLQLLLTNLSGSLLLAYFFWDKFLGNDTEYDQRPVWKPVVIFLGICIALLGFNLWASRQS